MVLCNFIMRQRQCHTVLNIMLSGAFVLWYIEFAWRYISIKVRILHQRKTGCKLLAYYSNVFLRSRLMTKWITSMAVFTNFNLYDYKARSSLVNALAPSLIYLLIYGFTQQIHCLKLYCGTDWWLWLICRYLEFMTDTKNGDGCCREERIG